jgi:hypothetical protein
VTRQSVCLSVCLSVGQSGSVFSPSGTLPRLFPQPAVSLAVHCPAHVFAAALLLCSRLVSSDTIAPRARGGLDPTEPRPPSPRHIPTPCARPPPPLPPLLLFGRAVTALAGGSRAAGGAGGAGRGHHLLQRHRRVVKANLRIPRGFRKGAKKL